MACSHNAHAARGFLVMKILAISSAAVLVLLLLGSLNAFSLYQTEGGLNIAEVIEVLPYGTKASLERKARGKVSPSAPLEVEPGANLTSVWVHTLVKERLCEYGSLRLGSRYESFTINEAPQFSQSTSLWSVVVEHLKKENNERRPTKQSSHRVLVNDRTSEIAGLGFLDTSICARLRSRSATPLQ